MPFAQIEPEIVLGAPTVAGKLLWHLGDHRPAGLKRFGRTIIEFCRDKPPAAILCTGIAPLTFDALKEIKRLGCRCINFLTDDPWSAFHKSRWFLRALAAYDYVFTTRRVNIGDLQRIGVASVSYLPFAWDPALFPDRQYSQQELDDYSADVVFAGGGDRDRVPYVAALAQNGFRVALYGGYWEKFAETRDLARGHLPVSELPKALRSARIALCLVRRANRDGHCMRTFEVPAAGGCMLTEDTDEHREIFGPDGERVIYFRTVNEMLLKAKWLVDNQQERECLALRAKAHIRTPLHTYTYRLNQILSQAGIGNCYRNQSQIRQP